MRFAILKKKFGKFTEFVLTDRKTNACVHIVPQVGSNVRKIVLFDGRKTVSVLRGDVNWKELSLCKGHKGSFLIPFPNRIRDGKYYLQGVKKQLPINFLSENHAIHGFVFDKKFIVVDSFAGEEFASLSTEYVLEKTKGYPFRLLVMIKHILSDKGYSCEICVVNKSKGSAPVGIGWHPYFCLSEFVEDVKLTLPSCKEILVDSKHIPTTKLGKSMMINKRVGSKSYDTGYSILRKDENVVTKLSTKKHILKIIQSRNPFSFVQVYTPPTRDSIAIEPMSCAADAFNNKFGLRYIKKSESIFGSILVTLNRN